MTTKDPKERPNGIELPPVLLTFIKNPADDLAAEEAKKAGLASDRAATEPRGATLKRSKTQAVPTTSADAQGAASGTQKPKLARAKTSKGIPAGSPPRSPNGRTSPDNGRASPVANGRASPSPSPDASPQPADPSQGEPNSAAASTDGVAASPPNGGISPSAAEKRESAIKFAVGNDE